jgi:hypothetical protein
MLEQKVAKRSIVPRMCAGKTGTFEPPPEVREGSEGLMARICSKMRLADNEGSWMLARRPEILSLRNLPPINWRGE